MLFILGTDAFSTINSWHKWKEILNYCHLVLINRNGGKSTTKTMPLEVQGLFKDNGTKDINELKKNTHGKIYSISMPAFDESSSEIRDRSMKNLNINEFLPKTIQDYINNNDLYKLPGQNK